MENPTEISKQLVNWASAYMRLSLRNFNAFARRSGLSMIQLNILTYLYHHGSCESSAICKLLQASRAAGSQMIDRLVSQGWVERMDSDVDRRVRLVQLTQTGREMVEQSIFARQKWTQNLLESLSDEETQKIEEALIILNERIQLLESAEKE